LVYGDLASSDLIAEESQKADIVCHFANCDDEPSAHAIIKGLAAKSSPGYLIHTSGTGILTVGDVQAGTYGEENPKIYNDWDGINEVTSLPDSAWHRLVDKIVLAGHKSSPNVKTAIVCPPTIYGPGRGPGNTYSDQWHWLAKAYVERGHAFSIGESKNLWTKIHVHDLSKLYLTLVEEAGELLVSQKKRSLLIDVVATNGGRATWNNEGYYFTEAGEYVWRDMMKKIAAEAKKQGYIQDDSLKPLTVEDGDSITPNGGKKWFVSPARIFSWLF
jgi:nucleoside-diphosphate-sugar epimerase